MRRIPAWLPFALAAVGVTSASADVWWSERQGEHRHEGLLPDQPISGKTFELIGVQLTPAGAQEAAPERVFLEIPDGAAAGLDFEVRERPSNYMMKPAESVGPGDPFEWRFSEVLGPAKILVDRLCVTAVQSGDEIHFPALIRGGGSRPMAPRYEFRFFSRAEYFATGTVRRETPDGLVKVRELEGAGGSEGLAKMVWDGMTSDQKPAERGRYVLELAGELYLNPTEDLRQQIRFFHYGGSLDWPGK